MFSLARRPLSGTPLAMLALVAALAAAATPRAAAAAKEAEGGGKRAYCDFERAVLETDEGKAASAKFKAERESRQAKVTKMEADLRAKKESLDKGGALMKAETRQQKEEEWQREVIEFQKLAVELEQELAESRHTLTHDLRKKVRTVVEKILDRDGYDDIMNTGNSNTGEIVLAYKRHRDITDLVIREYNRQFAKK